MTARGVKAHSPSTGAARQRSTTPTSTVRVSKTKDDSVEKTDSGAVVQDLKQNGNGTEKVRRGGETMIGDLPVKVKGQGRQQLVRQEQVGDMASV
ncbi:hypothetical protein CF326_g9190 [Tilletia indica]|nr:hypothetical protein CF326_g9190 [Tilletia indica]